MKIEIIEERNIQTPLKENVYTPSFITGDVVKLKAEKVKYSSDLINIIGRELSVRECKLAYLGNMTVEVVYLNQNEGESFVKNPYVAEHFVKVL